MYKLQRIANNPFLLPNKDHAWEAVAAFNPCLAQDGGTYHLLYRAQSFPQSQYGNVMSMSSIGYATSTDGVHFEDRRQLIKPDHRWEQFGCEDPRITKLGDKYYIFYTALSTYPFGANGIRVRVVEYTLEGVADAEPLYRLGVAILERRTRWAGERVAGPGGCGRPNRRRSRR